MNSLDKETVIAYVEMLTEATPEKLRDETRELLSTADELTARDFDLLRIVPLVLMADEEPLLVLAFSKEEAYKAMDLMEGFLEHFLVEFEDFVGTSGNAPDPVLSVFFLAVANFSAAIQAIHGIKLVPDA